MQKKQNFPRGRGNKWVVTIHGANPNGNCPILKLLKQQFQKD